MACKHTHAHARFISLLAHSSFFASAPAFAARICSIRLAHSSFFFFASAAAPPSQSEAAAVRWLPTATGRAAATRA